MERDNTTVVANVLINGMTEEEVFQSRCNLERMLPVFGVKLEDEDILWKIEYIDHEEYLMLSLVVCREYWLLYTENKEAMHTGITAAQPAIYREVH